MGLASWTHEGFSPSGHFVQLQIPRFPSGGQEQSCFMAQGIYHLEGFENSLKIQLRVSFRV